MTRRSLVRIVAPAAVALAASDARAVPLPVPDHFESPHVHPVDISPDGTKLFVVHTADHKLSIFDLTGPVPVRVGQVAVGLEPVTARARTDDEVWVVNHLSDSISLVRPSTLSVVRTLLAGDEPTDVVFDAARGQAFVSVSQEDLVRVWDTADLDAAPVDVPLAMSDPRALAIRGGSVYVAALDGQNETTTIHFQVVQANGGLPAPDPPMSGGLPAAPDVGLIVRHDGIAWRDETGASWSSVVPYTLLDRDVVEIDAVSLSVSGWFRGVGTNLFGVAVNPATGELFVTNQEASNEVRFEPNLRGSFVRSRVTRIDPGTGTVTPVHLNTHIDYGSPNGSAGERALSLATPMEIAFASDGSAAYLAAMGSAKVGVLDAAGTVTRRIAVGQGPSGLALDEARDRLYVVNRFASTLSVVDLSDDSSVEITLGFDGSDPAVLNGRRFLYDGELSSAHGDLACATCHVFGGMDNIAWDLGDPTGSFVSNPPFQGFHPMKGPMTTQSLRGLAGTEPFHWRGDRTGFPAFNPAFASLLGGSPLSASDMQAFTDFVMTMKNPPNPNRNLDGSHLASLNGADPAHGEVLFNTGGLVGGLQCVTCHTFPTGENGTLIPGTLLQEDQDMVVPQLRNMYEKTRFDATATTNVRGFGYTHDGAVDDLFTFLDFPGFTFNSVSDQEDVAAFLLAFPGDAHAAVGAQWTMDGTNEAQGIARVNGLVSLASQSLIGLIAKGCDGAGEARGWYWETGSGFVPDRALETPVPLGTLLGNAGPGTEVTFTAVPKGNELRLGIDQDGDGYPDRDEHDAGTDPGDPDSTPPDAVGAPLALLGPARPAIWLAGANPARVESRIGVRLPADGPARLDVFDLAGRRVRTLLDGAAGPGASEHRWDLRDAAGRRVSAGVYFVRLSTPGRSVGERVVVLR